MQLHLPCVARREAGRLALALVGTTNTFLATWGADCTYEALAALHEQMAPLVRLAWPDPRLPRLKVGGLGAWALFGNTPVQPQTSADRQLLQPQCPVPSARGDPT